MIAAAHLQHAFRHFPGTNVHQLALHSYHLLQCTAVGLATTYDKVGTMNTFSGTKPSALS